MSEHKLMIRAYKGNEPDIKLDADTIMYASYYHDVAKIVWVGISACNNATNITLEPDANNEIVIYLDNERTAWISSRNHVPYWLKNGKHTLVRTIILDELGREIE